MTPPDILLTHGYFLSENSPAPRSIRPYVPLGMLYLSSHLKSKGFKVEVVDPTFAERDDLYERLRTGRPSTLCLCSCAETRASVIEILGVARLAGWTTILCGSESGSDTQEYLDAGANFVVLGEAEITMTELLAAINIGATATRLAVIHGIAYLGAKGDLCQTTAREQFIDLDSQPWPDRKAVDLQPYLDAWRMHHGKSSLQLVTTRAGCAWDRENGKQNHQNRSVKLVVDEIEFLVKEYHPDQLFVADDFFTLQSDWLIELAAEMKARGLEVPLECISPSDSMNEATSSLLTDVGCYRMWIGPESSQRILDTMGNVILHEAAGVEA